MHICTQQKCFYYNTLNHTTTHKGKTAKILIGVCGLLLSIADRSFLGQLCHFRHCLIQMTIMLWSYIWLVLMRGCSDLHIPIFVMAWTSPSFCPYLIIILSCLWLRQQASLSLTLRVLEIFFFGDSSSETACLVPKIKGWGLVLNWVIKEGR